MTVLLVTHFMEEAERLCDRLALLGAAAFGTDLPRNPLGFLAAFLLATASLFAIGLVVAALAPTGRVATGIGLILFYPMNFLRGPVAAEGRDTGGAAA